MGGGASAPTFAGEFHDLTVADLDNKLRNLGEWRGKFGMEAKTNEEIKLEVQKLGATFSVMTKSKVNGWSVCPVYRFLKAQRGCSGLITWNFRTKFLISRDGKVVLRFDGVKFKDMEPDIVKFLAQPDPASSSSASSAPIILPDAGTAVAG